MKSGQRALVTLERCSMVLGGRTVLDNVTFELRAGQRWALIGPNGSGKTLLLKLLRGDLWPTPTGRESRTYWLDPTDGPEGSSEPPGRKERIAYVGPERQDRYLRRELNLDVTRIVTTGLFDEDIPLTQPNRAERARVTRLLHRFGLWELRRRHVLGLSYGQQRLALIARAFAGNPAVLLLDEVFNGLDASIRQRLRKALEQAGSRGPAWILSTHRAADLPANVSHRALVSKGRIVAAAPVDARTGRDVHDHAETVRAIPPEIARRRSSAVSNEPLIRIRNVDLYRDYRRVLRNINWTLRTGEHWGVLGRNGSGKSTLLTLLYGDLHPALGGTIERRGAPLGTPIETWKRRVAIVSPELQAAHFRATSLEEIVASGRYASIGLNEPATPADRRGARRWLRYFGLGALAARRPREVSYGQLRLALFARAMILDPELLLLDEPFTGLDADLHGEVHAFIEQLARRGTQIVMAVHHEGDLIPSIRHLLKIRQGGRMEAIPR